VSLYRGDGSGTFVAAGSYLTGQAPVSLAASDLDYDGTVDLICGNAGSQDLAVLLFSQL
jgi:VCBS repeat protein